MSVTGKTSLQHDAASPPLWATVSMALIRWFSLPGSLHTWQWELWWNSSIFISSGQRIFLVIAQEPNQLPFDKPPVGCLVPVSEELLPSGHSSFKAWLEECCTNSYPLLLLSLTARFRKFFHLKMMNLYSWALSPSLHLCPETDRSTLTCTINYKTVCKEVCAFTKCIVWI